MLQPRQHYLLGGFLDLARKKHLIQDRINLVKVEHQVQLTDVPKERVQDLDKKVDRLEVCQLVIVRVHAHAEEEASVATIYDFIVPELRSLARCIGEEGRIT